MGVLIFLFCVFLAAVIYIRIKILDTTVSKDAIEFYTEKSVSQITEALRSFDCMMHRLNDDPLEDGPGPAIAVLMVGEPKLIEWFKHIGGATSIWGVQVIVEDLGNRRHVELIALGHNVWSRSRDNKGYGMGFSRDYRDKIAQMIA